MPQFRFTEVIGITMLRPKPEQKWRRTVSHGRRLCCYCGKYIQKKEKHDQDINQPLTGLRDYAHTTCGLVQLSTLPQETWKGRRVVHPAEQQGDKSTEWGWPLDQGVVQFWEPKTQHGQLVMEVYWRPDGLDATNHDFCLHYKATNLWTRQ